MGLAAGYSVGIRNKGVRGRTAAGEEYSQKKSVCEELCRTAWSDWDNPEKAQYVSNSDRNSFFFLGVMLSSAMFLVILN